MKLFEINHFATGQYFIGRKNEIEFFQKNFFNEVAQGNSKFYSLTGMNRIGKTSLVKELCERFRAESHSNVFLIDTSLDGKYGFWQYWIFSVLLPLIQQIQLDQINEEYRAELKEYCDYFQNREKWNVLFSGDCVADLEAKEQMESLFFLLHRAKKQILIIIDEFDKAGQVFGTRAENFGWFRGLLQQVPGISVLTISRRSIYYIEYNNFGGSTLHGIFTKRSLFGFSNSDIDEFYNKIESTVNFKLKQKTKEDIWYYCGRSPQYLAIVGDALANEKTTTQVDIYKIATTFYDNFDAIINLLKEEKLLMTMLQVFVGPKYNLKRSDIDKLVSLGYCMTKSALDAQSNPNEFSDYCYPENTGSYLTVSDFFVDYLFDVHQSELDNIWPMLSRTEKLLRTIIEKEFSKMYPDTWRGVLKKVIMGDDTKDFHNTFLDSHEKIYQNASQESQQLVGNSILNVSSLRNLGYVIRTNWYDHFKKYFHISLHSFNEGIEIMYEARNPITHSNGELLSDSAIADVEDVCNEFICSINSVLDLSTEK